jgi:hypothetical protein
MYVLVGHRRHFSAHSLERLLDMDKGKIKPLLSYTGIKRHRTLCPLPDKRLPDKVRRIKPIVLSRAERVKGTEFLLDGLPPAWRHSSSDLVCRD